MLNKCENKGDDMIDILQYIHDRYVPHLSETVYIPTLFGGDQLTRERAFHSQDSKLQSSTPMKRLLGVVPECEDWHAKNSYYQVIHKK